MKAEQIKRAVSPLAFYRFELPGAPGWKNGATGWADGGLCPFHADRNPGTFRVNLSTGGYHCFSCGARGGSIVDFTMTRHGLSFIEAVRQLRLDWGV